jgi:protein kinase-like protein
MADEPPLASTVASTGTQGPDADVYSGGTMVGRYRIERCLGRGGMGIVYAARDTVLGRTIALKLLARRRAGNERLKGRLHREAQALARLSHPNVVTVFDVGVHDEHVYLAMELLSGGTLADRIRSRPPRSEMLELLVEAGRGLAAAHERGIIHRDFKPENVLVDEAGHVRVSDFGLARASDEDPVGSSEERPLSSVVSPLYLTMTEDGGVIGTPRYMAPEQRAGDRATASSDQYSFCVTAWEAFTGELPPQARSHDATASRSSNGARRFSGPIARVLSRGLQPKPSDRFPSMAALVDRLTRQRLSKRFGAGAVLAAVLVAAAAAAGYAAARRRSTTSENANAEWVSLDSRAREVALAVEADGRASLFVRTPAGTVSHARQDRVGSTVWTPWQDLGGSIREAPAVAQASGRTHLVARGPDGAFWHLVERSADRYEDWESLGGDAAFPAVGVNADGRLEILGVGGNGALWHVWEDRTRGVWSAWFPMNENPSSPGRITRGADGRLHVFCIDGKGRVQHRAQTKPNNGWGEWTSLGGWFVGTPTIIGDGRFGVIARAADGGLWWSREGPQGFSEWESLNRAAQGEVAWASLPDGRVALFAAGSDGRLWTTIDNAAGAFGAWTAHRQTLLGSPLAVTTAAGPLVVIRREDGSLAAHVGMP